jgi:hypothetical protein
VDANAGGATTILTSEAPADAAEKLERDAASTGSSVSAHALGLLGVQPPPPPWNGAEVVEYWKTNGLIGEGGDTTVGSPAVPEGIDLRGVRSFLAALPGVVDVHDLHVWALSTSETALTVHLVKPDGGGDDDWLARVAQELHDRFLIEHSTIQVEGGRATHPCKPCSNDTVPVANAIVP